jgi:hypothetical protein
MYAEFCRQHYAPLHFQPWWLDAVAGPGGWSAAVARDGDGRPTGIWPYVRRRRFGLSWLGQPPLTAYAGPWLSPFAPPDAKRPSRLRFEAHTLARLAHALPSTCWLEQQLHPDTAGGLPLYWQGFRLGLRYTYRLPRGTTAADWRAAMPSELRKKLEQAARQFVLTVEDDPGLLLECYAGSMRRRYRSVPTGAAAAFERLYTAVQARDQGRIVVARERSTGTAVAAQWVVWDEQQATLLLGGQYYGAMETGRVNYLLLEFAGNLGMDGGRRGLDFEGSMTPGVAHVFRQLAGVPTPYLRVGKSPYRLLDSVLYGIR